MDFARGCFFMAGMAVAAVGAVDTADASVIQTETRLVGPASGNLGSSLDLLFDPIANAYDLVSIGAGSVTTSEAGRFDLSVIYVDDTTASVGEFSVAGQSSLSLPSIPDEFFTPFDMGDVKGLRFSYVNGSGIGGNFFNVSIPELTAVTFAYVPLPATLALLPIGLLALGAAGRRRRASAPLPDAERAARA